MARRKKASSRRTRGKKQQYRLMDNLLGIIVCLLMLVGLFNLGVLGTFLDNCFKIFVGSSFPIAMIIVFLYGLCFALYGHRPHFKKRWITGAIIAYIGLLMWLQTVMFQRLNLHAKVIETTWNSLSKVIFNGDSTVPVGGGMIGAYLYNGSNILISEVGTAVLSWLLMIIGIIVFFALPWREFLVKCGIGIKKSGAAMANAHDQLMKKRTERATKTTTVPSISEPLSKASRQVKDFFADQEPAEPSPPVSSPSIISQDPVEPTIRVASESQVEGTHSGTQDEQTSKQHDDTEIKLAGIDAKEDNDYQLPPVSLLSQVKATDQQEDLNNIKKNTKTLQQTLKSFGVDATVENVNLGPSVTKYELRPAVGVKVSRITHLADDLALALAAKDIRIEAPIPGKSLIGIEVPNQQIATVGFRDMIENAPSNDNPMEVPLGRSVTGDIKMADLTKMPHLLIAGATGSGKSVAINVIITSILLKAKPHQVKMLMIDPKKVELSVYNGIPHLLSPVVSEPKKAARALGKVVAEMERRYELFAKFGVRNLDGYNKLVKQQNDDHPDEVQANLPLILVIVDELADLMMTVSHDVEDAIVRIAQMGRAAGIHMILATQRPSVDVITGLIKANVPSRIAFAVSSGVDSRTIIDTNGAEKLLGRGDMLFEPIDQNKPVRIQGAFISDHDVESVVDFIKNERAAEYDDNMVVTDNEIEQEEQAEEEDELFPEALDFVVDQQKASTSLIQRRFRIGYNRAARIIDDMEQRGFIGPANGSKPREVYKQKSEE
ncbi:cell division protein FtsK [Limosilactobacillus reuteri]|uniref:DNA translocase FtsK n=1 Tax=Limosilactobacillus reuteri TaxID=1598 RepID=A0A256SVB3_LIMRT|nr:DNA translocase FtsK [Limosilactobacillus reuteri]OYS47420.1 cell division protein FtsK [Limosilactobacillus reuteri]OYS49635.1 cell division protein FtsK [Limosilactobacillus reuteri]OYS54827.1 cell division protein FtsK [Limosilactobacillus reuteri]OYS56161.1 cell division protein FtsK [Limosilactobacillus reuteri]OYS63727.1 cell division protein FtsK [Limosilactobacillus reuteri]